MNRLAPRSRRWTLATADRPVVRRASSPRRARELVLWIVNSNGSARAFYERKGMRWDGGEQERSLGAETLHEVRYRTEWGASR